MNKRLVLFLLGCVVIIAAFLRLYLLPSHLFFGPEQGRDLLVVKDIVLNHKLTLIGAKTDIDGVFHGPFFYYAMSIPFLLSHGNPVFISIWFVIIHALSVVILYLLTRELTDSKRTPFIAAVLFACSFEGIVYARWLSNPPLSIPLVVLFMYAVILFLKRKNYWLFITIGCLYGLLGQVEFINYLLFAFVLIGISIRYKKNIRTVPFSYWIAICIATLFFAFGSYALFDIRHDFLITKSVLRLLSGHGYTLPFIQAIQSVFLMYGKEFGLTFGATGAAIAIPLLTVLYGFVISKKIPYKDVVVLWMVMPLFALALLRHTVLEQILVAVIPAWIIGVSIGIDGLLKKSLWIGIITICMLITMNMYMYIRYIPTNEQVFFQKSQSRILYSDQIQVIHTIYIHAKAQPFFFQSFTIPVFWQDGWKYLFWYIGNSFYDYLPEEKDKSDVYVIIPNIHDDPFLSLFQKNWYRDTVSQWGTKIFETQIGEFGIEKRIK